MRVVRIRRCNRLWAIVLAVPLITLAVDLLHGTPQVTGTATVQDTERLYDTYLEALQTVHERYATRSTYQDLVHASIYGMAGGLDPHTSFLTPEAFAGMRSRQAATFFGVGILVSQRDGRLIVISPIEGGPASRSGILTGDVIGRIDGVPTDVLTLDAAVSRIRGPQGTPVMLTILRRGLSSPLDVELLRDEIPQETVRYAYMMDGGTAYLRLTDFSRSTAQEFADAMRSLRSQGMMRLLLDLRSNGGGLLDAVVDVADHFVPEGELIVETAGRIASSRAVYRAQGAYPAWNLPLVVLTNNGTASAAEILSGAIQDHDLGLVVGTTSWGKGVVQTVYPLAGSAAFALTTSAYLTPSGRNIQRDFTSIFDYYQFDSPNGNSAPSEVFRTASGRPVLASGGITPDVEVEVEPLPPGADLLFARNAFMQFALDFVRENGGPPVDWQPPSELLDDFVVWLGREGLMEADSLDLNEPSTSTFVLRQIHSDIMNTVYGVEAAHRVLAEGDFQIQEALGLFDDAAELLRSLQAR